MVSIDAIARLPCPEELLLQLANATVKIGNIASTEMIFTRVEDFNPGTSINWGCSWIIRVGPARHERHLTGAAIGKIAYMKLRPFDLT